MTSLTLVRRMHARPEIIFEMLTIADRMAEWWGPDGGPVLRAESKPKIGGRFRVRFRLLDGSEHETNGEFLEFAPPWRVVMSWWWTDRAAEGVSRVEFKLRQIADGTELTLIHDRLADEDTRLTHEKGWAGALVKLEAKCVASAHA